jgi:hypothetical protein
VNPSYPLYVVSKGRADTRLTSKALERMQVPYRIVVEAQEYDAYAAVVDVAKILVLDSAYQRAYASCDDVGDTKSMGPGPARNFAWDHAIAQGSAWHWVMDDNIRVFYRLQRHRKIQFLDGSCFACMETFCARYDNIAMAGPNYQWLAKQRQALPPFILNTRIYSCNLIRNDVPFRWRGRYNEDTDLSLRLLKAGWCTVQFNAFLQDKQTTQSVPGGNTAAFYATEGTLPKSQMLVRLHPDVARLVWKFGRWHHHVDYRPFKAHGLRLKPGSTVPRGVNDYGLRLVKVGS